MDDIRGIELIGEMTKVQLVDEIQEHNRRLLMGTEMAQLKGLVIDARMNLYRERLEKEANIEVHRSLFGSHVHDKDEED